MIYLGLDLSKRSTGWAVWNTASDRPLSGRWVLGSEFTPPGQVFCKLHQCLDELRQVMPFELIGHEEAINPANLAGFTNIKTIHLASGLAAHVQSYAFARGCRVQQINISSWRRDFIGTALVSDANAEAKRRRKAGGKGSASDKLKRLTKERCEQFGWTPGGFDEADALGVLDYLVSLDHVTSPWREAEVLRPMLGAQT